MSTGTIPSFISFKTALRKFFVEPMKNQVFGEYCLDLVRSQEILDFTVVPQKQNCSEHQHYDHCRCRSHDEPTAAHHPVSLRLNQRN